MIATTALRWRSPVAITVGTVERIWRYPIKSTGGESLERVVAPGPVRLGDPVTLI